jgi:hypothetical protein
MHSLPRLTIPPCAHHDPSCAMQTRNWTSTQTIQNGGYTLDWLATLL